MACWSLITLAGPFFMFWVRIAAYFIDYRYKG
nr:MAG TPA: hypothetical protein [Caudoviricetes sp.]